MYSPGKIIYFDPFYFKNGNTNKPKYFIVLHNNSNNTLLASLPTRTDHIPGNLVVKHGCISSDEINFNCYHFEANKPITTNGWGFNQPTFIYGSEINDYEVKLLNQIYQVEKVDYEIIGSLKKEEFKNLVECFLKSTSVKRKYKSLLREII